MTARRRRRRPPPPPRRCRHNLLLASGLGLGATASAQNSTAPAVLRPLVLCCAQPGRAHSETISRSLCCCCCSSPLCHLVRSVRPARWPNSCRSNVFVCVCVCVCCFQSNLWKAKKPESERILSFSLLYASGASLFAAALCADVSPQPARIRMFDSTRHNKTSKLCVCV